MTRQWRMTCEIADQPDVFEARATHWMSAAEPLREVIQRRSRLALLGRGSSKNACVYASLLYGLATGQQAVRFRPWLTTIDVPRADWSDTAALVFSASGQSTDIARAAQWIVDRGGYTVGVTNAERGEPCALEESTDSLLHLDVGDERAVPATKSFNAQLLASAALLGFDVEAAIPELAQCLRALEEREVAKELADLIGDARTVAWIARGPSMAAARDAALKCRECARLDSTGWSAAEIQHGHIGSLDHRDRAVIFSDANQPAGSFSALSKGLLNRNTPFAVIGLDYYRENGASAAPVLQLELPQKRWARPIVFAYLSQQVALELAVRQGLDPDYPAGLQKVTETL